MGKMRFLGIGVTIALYGASCASLLRAAGPVPQEPEPERPVFEYQGPDLPKYYVVETFFQTLFFCYTSDSSRQTYRKALEAMAIPARTEAERAMTRAMFRAQAAATYRPDLGPFMEDAEGAKQIQLKYLRKRVLALRAAYWGLLTDLEELKVPTGSLEEHLESRVRPTFTMVSIGGPGDDVFAVARLFDVPRKSRQSDDERDGKDN